jgi:hypothetical protein
VEQSTEARHRKARNLFAYLQHLEAESFPLEKGLGACSSRFTLELLNALGPAGQDVEMLDALISAQLRHESLTIEPLGWLHGERAPRSMELPRLLKLSTAGRPEPVSAQLLRPLMHSWTTVVEMALKASQEGVIGRWCRGECEAALRALVMRYLVGSSEQSGEFADLLAADFEGVGLGLWNVLAHRLAVLTLERDQPLLSQKFQHRVLLHIQGSVVRQRLGAGKRDSNPPGADAAVSSTAQDSGLDQRSGASGHGRIVVLEPIPPGAERHEREVLSQFAALREPVAVLGLPPAKNIKMVLEKLTSEFPWAADAVARIDDLLIPAALLGSNELWLPPVLLVGSPGSGKSRFARRVAELLTLPFMPVPCGGAADSQLLVGTTRGWATGAPSPVLKLLLDRRSASAFVLLDELDKGLSRGSTASNAVPLASAILSMIEPETARRWRDGFLQAQCDISRVVFWATANQISGMPKPLLSRFELVHIPLPAPDHLQALADSVTTELEQEWGVPEGTMPRFPLDPDAVKTMSARELRSMMRRRLAAWARETLDPGRSH